MSVVRVHPGEPHKGEPVARFEVGGSTPILSTNSPWLNWTEQRNSTPKVVGSNPTGEATMNKEVQMLTEIGGSLVTYILWLSALLGMIGGITLVSLIVQYRKDLGLDVFMEDAYMAEKNNNVEDPDWFRDRVVWCFNEDEKPNYIQGRLGEHEICDPVTAVSCNTMVTLIELLRERNGALEARLAAAIASLGEA